MRPLLAFFVSLALAVPGGAAAQIVPMPGADNIRLQTVEWIPGEDVLLTILPQGSLTVILEDNRQIERVTVGDSSPLSVRVTPEGNAFVLVPGGEIARTELLVETGERAYRFIVRTQESGLAGLVVHFVDPAELAAQAMQPAPASGDQVYTYRIRGATSVRPVSLRDDTVRTFIEYAPEQPLPAVFAIGPTGEEEVVNGYMRGDLYVIDRVYDELVFRIDRERATARRNTVPETRG